MTRAVSFDKARASYPHRFTMEHVPQWANEPAENGLYYKPQFASDREWYENTLFPGEEHLSKRDKFCESKPTWPLGEGFSPSRFHRSFANA